MSTTAKPPKALRGKLSESQNRNLELVFVGASVWGVVSSTKNLAESWQDDDGLERSANLFSLVAAVLGLLISVRNFRRGGNR